uniref:DUF3352 domain-containing protein n=1 Tax=Sphaerothrix gracilis TaxID=3151835 RepID=UPI0031FD1529
WPPEALPAPADEPPELAPLSWSRDRLIRAIAALPDTAPDFEIEIEPEAPQPPMLPSLAVAVLPGYLVMSAQAAPVRQLIAGQRSQAPTLLDASQFQPTLTNPDFEQALVTIYGNVGQINRYAVADPTIFDLPFPPPLPIPLPFPRPDFSSEDIRALTETDAVLESFVKVTDGGILAQGRAYIDPAQPLELGQAPAATNPLPQLLPAPTYLFSSGYDLGGLGLRLLRLLESFNIEQIDTGLAFLNIAVTAATGLDLEADILAWMDGAYGFFLFPSREGLVSEFEPQIELGLGLMLQTSDRPAAEQALQALDQFLLSNGVTVESQTINDVAATRWEIALTEGASPTDIVGYGWPSEDVLTLAAGSGSLRRLLNPRPYEPLAEHTTFQNAIAPFPAENQGYSYINMGSTLSFLYRALGLSLETPFVPEAQRFLGTLHSISLTTSQAADYAQADLFFVLAPAED